MSTGRGARGGTAGRCAVWDPGQPATSGAGQQPDRGRRGRTEGWRPPSEPRRVEAGTIRVAALDACGRSELPRESLPRLPREPLVRRLLGAPCPPGSRNWLHLRLRG